MAGWCWSQYSVIGIALDQLHHEVRPARLASRRRRSTLRDVRVVHQRQRLPLGLEAGDDLPRVHAQLDDLERDAGAGPAAPARPARPCPCRLRRASARGGTGRSHRWRRTSGLRSRHIGISTGGRLVADRSWCSFSEWACVSLSRGTAQSYPFRARRAHLRPGSCFARAGRGR